MAQQSKDEIIVDLQRQVGELTRYKQEFVQVCDQLQHIDRQLRAREERDAASAESSAKLHEQLVRLQNENAELIRDKNELSDKLVQLHSAADSDRAWGERLERQLEVRAAAAAAAGAPLCPPPRHPGANASSGHSYVLFAACSGR